MALTALRGAIGFLSRMPVGTDTDAWDAFRTTPVAFPVAGYLVGAVLVAPFLLPVPAPVAAFGFVTWVYLVTGIPHADAISDLGDAAVVHGSPEDRRAVMTDTAVGVGGVLALGLVLVGLWAAGLQLAQLPLRAAALVITAEVGAKFAMTTVACLGTPTHEGLGSAIVNPLSPRSLGLPGLVTLPAAALTWPHPAAVVALAAALAAAAGSLWWARDRLGGVSGDVIGGANELARLAALLAGVIAWMHF